MSLLIQDDNTSLDANVTNQEEVDTTSVETPETGQLDNGTVLEEADDTQLLDLANENTTDAQQEEFGQTDQINNETLLTNASIIEETIEDQLVNVTQSILNQTTTPVEFNTTVAELNATLGGSIFIEGEPELAEDFTTVSENLSEIIVTEIMEDQQINQIANQVASISGVDSGFVGLTLERINSAIPEANTAQVISQISSELKENPTGNVAQSIAVLAQLEALADPEQLEQATSQIASQVTAGENIEQAITKLAQPIALQLGALGLSGALPALPGGTPGLGLRGTVPGTGGGTDTPIGRYPFKFEVVVDRFPVPVFGKVCGTVNLTTKTVTVAMDAYNGLIKAKKTFNSGNPSWQTCSSDVTEKFSWKKTIATNPSTGKKVIVGFSIPAKACIKINLDWNNKRLTGEANACIDFPSWASRYGFNDGCESKGHTWANWAGKV